MEKRKETLTTLREMIEDYRKLLFNMENIGEEINDFLLLRDQIHQLTKKLKEIGTDLSVEKSRLDSFDQVFKNRRKLILRKLTSTFDFKSYRQQNQIPAERWWWYIDESLKKQRQKRLQRWTKKLVVITVVLLSVWAIFTWVIPKPPAYLLHQEKADQLTSQGNLDEAIEEYKKAMELNPQDGTSYLMLGILYQAKEEEEKAKDYFAQAEKTLSDPLQFYLQRGMAYLQQNKLDKAYQDASAALKLTPDNINAHFLMGNVCEAQDHIAEALQHLEVVANAPDADPKLTVMARFKLGMLMLRGMALPQ